MRDSVSHVLSVLLVFFAGTKCSFTWSTGSWISVPPMFQRC